MINSFGSLTAAVADWLARSDLTAVIPTFVQLAEIRIFDDPVDPLRVRQMQTVVTGTPVGSVIALPDDYLQIQTLSVDYGGRQQTLDPLAAEGPATTATVPLGYTVIGNEIHIAGENAGDYSLTYFARPPALETAGTNWLILRAPNVYLFATLLEAAPYLKDQPSVPAWGAELQRALAGLRALDDRARFGPGLRQRPVMYTP